MAKKVRPTGTDIPAPALRVRPAVTVEIEGREKPLQQDHNDLGRAEFR
jgi:hypothetical protein